MLVLRTRLPQLHMFRQLRRTLELLLCLLRRYLPPRWPPHLPLTYLYPTPLVQPPLRAPFIKLRVQHQLTRGCPTIRGRTTREKGMGGLFGRGMEQRKREGEREVQSTKHRLILVRCLEHRSGKLLVRLQMLRVLCCQELGVRLHNIKHRISNNSSHNNSLLQQ